MPAADRSDNLRLPYLDRHGWLRPASGVRRVSSPNADQRPPGSAIDLLVIHNISLPPGVFGGPAIEALFTNHLDAQSHPDFRALANLRVSAHFLIRRDGELLQFVSTEQRAWHAGISRFGARERCNDFSIGIELEGTDLLPYTDSQYQVLAALTRRLRHRYPLRAATGHQHIAPRRKSDPGPAFHWAYYARLCGWTYRQLAVD